MYSCQLDYMLKSLKAKQQGTFLLFSTLLLLNNQVLDQKHWTNFSLFMQVPLKFCVETVKQNDYMSYL